MKDKFEQTINLLNKEIKHKEISEQLGVSLDQVKKISRLNNTYKLLENKGLDTKLFNVFKSLKYKGLILSKLFDNLDALKEVLIRIDKNGITTSSYIKEEVQLISQIIDSDKKEYINNKKQSIVERVLDYNKIRVSSLNYLNDNGYVCTLDCIIDGHCFNIISFNQDSIYGFDIILNNKKLLEVLSYYKNNPQESAEIYTICNKFYIITLDDSKNEIDELIKISSSVIGILYIQYDNDINEYKVSKIIENNIYQGLDDSQIERVRFQISRDLTEKNVKQQIGQCMRTDKILSKSI